MIAALDPLSVVNTAYDKDFRWWFLCLLALMIAGALWGFRYLLLKSEAERDIHDRHITALMGELTTSRQHHHDRIERLTADAFTVTRELTAVVAANSKVIEASTRESERIRQIIENR